MAVRTVRDLLRTPGPLLAIAPSLIVLLGSAMLGICSAYLFPFAGSRALDLGTWPLFTIVPLVEEVVFRGGVSTTLRQYFGVGWGAYSSALLFSVVHTMPSADRVLSGEAGVVLGPLFLGVICEWLRTRSRSLWPGIFLHGACNATPVIFTALDPRWQQWLDFLYL